MGTPSNAGTVGIQRDFPQPTKHKARWPRGSPLQSRLWPKTLGKSLPYLNLGRRSTKVLRHPSCRDLDP